MDNYRLLTDEEIGVLEENGCHAEDWTAVSVTDGFTPANVRDVSFYGEVNIGAMDKYIEVSHGFRKHSGIVNASLRDVTIGDNCLIENVGGYINNYTIGEDCYISNVNIIETTDGATYGQGNMVSVLNEMGDGNVMFFDGLTSQLAAIMVENDHDKEFTRAIKSMIKNHIEDQSLDRGMIGDRVKIVNTGEVTNTYISDDCEINAACRLSDCTIKGVPQASVYIGSGVICENSIICDGSSLLNSAKVVNCFVGEACQITNGFTAEGSVFFANSYMANGESCAAFCGPFTSSHHKSSLLIGGMFSFYNAGSATNFSNHAYKMGPMHHGKLRRGTKTASGSYIFLPANIGVFSVCLGKIMSHPDSDSLPFSYIIGENDRTIILPGRNIATVGLYRDIRKWQKRDMRSHGGQGSIINFDWLNPHSMGAVLRGKKILEGLRDTFGGDAGEYDYNGCAITARSIDKGIAYYDMVLRLFMGDALDANPATPPSTYVGKGDWKDLQGLLLPASEERRLIGDVKDGTVETIDEITTRFNEINANYTEYRRVWAYQMILDYYDIDTIDEACAGRIHDDCVAAKREWIGLIRKDAEKEFALGDVEESVLNDFVRQLDNEFNTLTYK